DRFPVADVEVPGTAFLSGVLDELGDFVDGRVDIGGSDRGAFVGKEERRGAPHAAGRAGDENDFSFDGSAELCVAHGGVIPPGEPVGSCMCWTPARGASAMGSARGPEGPSGECDAVPSRSSGARCGLSCPKADLVLVRIDLDVGETGGGKSPGEGCG